MNIIWLTPEVAYPPIGGRNGVYNRIVHMSKKNNIFLFSISYNGEEETISEQEMKKYCKFVFHYNRGAHKISTLFKSIFLPFSVASRTSKKTQRKMVEVIKENQIDYIIVDFPNMALNVIKIKKYLKNIKVTLNEHNIEFERMRSMKDIKTISAKKRLMYKLESGRLKRYENRVYKHKFISSITFFSKDDYESFPKSFPKCRAKLAVFPLGANEINAPCSSKEKALIFIGRLDEVAITNVEAVLWFCKEIFPLVLEKKPNQTLVIAGSRPCDEVTKLANKNIKVIPNYDKVEDIFSMGDCVILPLLSGGGVKGKLIEAASSKKMIITTDKGVEGTIFENNKDLIVTNDAKEFANSIINYIDNEKSFEKMRESCYLKFINNYKWDSIVSKYDEFLKNI